jgi:hypothetical protein
MKYGIQRKDAKVHWCVFLVHRNVVVQQCSAKGCQKIYFRDDLRATLDEGSRSTDQ